ncbi:hypothetical protein JOQ06_017826 [Pogonophryne albipinna]|uniref:Transposable element P transposase-like RNase H domain-containing protein n=1 Tax=Pogonophryne albipinna TaxID=1090488 RepID=A0AAD6AHX0_9TELE|nr:hypothetical protein JOQ06_017826 [Pogonophryne albipinna]
MGDGNNETDVATEALVFMVVGLQGHWKAPIAYYLTKSLSPETQRVLLSHALEELHARGIRVVSVTMDGHASNVSMCNQLGCELKGNPQEPLQTSFPHPSTGDKVFVMMDACHMLKLARNMLQIEAAQTPIKRSLPALNLPAVLPRALEMEKGRLGVTMLRVLIQRNPTAVLFLITHEPRVCANPLYNSTPQPQVRAQSHRLRVKAPPPLLYAHITESSLSSDTRTHQMFPKAIGKNPQPLKEEVRIWQPDDN